MRHSKGPRIKVVVDYELCDSNAVCQQITPEVFHVGDDDVLHIVEGRATERLRPRIEDSVRRCPKQALSIVTIGEEGS